MKYMYYFSSIFYILAVASVSAAEVTFTETPITKEVESNEVVSGNVEFQHIPTETKVIQLLKGWGEVETVNPVTNDPFINITRYENDLGPSYLQFSLVDTVPQLCLIVMQVGNPQVPMDKAEEGTIPCSIHTDRRLNEELEGGCFYQSTPPQGLKITFVPTDRGLVLRIMEAVKRDNEFSLRMLGNSATDINFSLKGGARAVNRMKEYCGW